MNSPETQSRHSMQRLVICVRSRDGWCELLDQHNTAYRDMMATKCGNIVTLPWGIKYRKPTCAECRKADNTPAQEGERLS